MPAKSTARRSMEQRAEFQVKSEFLAAHFQPIAPLEYQRILFGQDDGPRLYVIENSTYSVGSIEDILFLSTMRSDVYVPPCSFFNGFYKLTTLAKQFALVVDVDRVHPLDLERLTKAIRGGHVIAPTLIGNSGSGLHLVYVFSQPVDAYTRRKPILRAMCRALAERVQDFGRADRNSLIQAYRMPGCQTKLGDTMTGYRVGLCYEPLALARLLNVDASNWGNGRMPENDSQNNKAPASEPKKARVAVMPRVANGRKLYDYVTWRVYRDTPVGNRYTAMFGIAIVGYKCRSGGVTREEVQKELEELATLWTYHDPEHPVKLSEVPKAMKGYSNDFVCVSSAQLSEYFGWEWERKTRRRPKGDRLKRAEHLEIARASKDMRTKFKKKRQIEAYLKEHPEATQREMASALKMSLSTVSKYSKMVRQQPGK